MPAYLPLLPLVLRDLRIVFRDGWALDARAEAYVAAQLVRQEAQARGELPPSWEAELAKSRFPPMTHQREALLRLAYEPRMGLFYDPGLGKTKVLLDAIRALHFTGTPQLAVVLVPSGTLVNNWLREAELHHPGVFQLRGATSASGSVQPRAARVKRIQELQALDPVAGPRLYVTTYGSLASDAAALKLLEVTFLVCDESHALMTPTSARTQQVLDTFSHAYRRVCATGTASQGNPCHLYGPYKLLAPHLITLDAHAYIRHVSVMEVVFRCTTCGTPNRPVPPLHGLPQGIAAPSACRACLRAEFQRQNRTVGFRNMAELSWVSSQVALRREAAHCVNLPPRRFIDVPTPVTRELRKAYNALLAGVFDKQRLLEVPSESAPGAAESVAVTVAENRVLRCLQILSGLRGETQEDGTRVTHVLEEARDARLAVLMDLVAPIHAAEKKVIIWYGFSQEGDDIMARLEAEGVQAVRVDGSTRDPVAQQDRFRTDPALTAYVAQVQTGVGYTLTEATFTIWYGYTLDAKVYRQALERNYRIGQRESVTVYRLVVPGSLHEPLVTVLDDAASADRALSAAQRDLCLHCPNFLDCRERGVVPYTTGCPVTSDRKTKTKYQPRAL